MDLATLIGFLASAATILLSIYLGGSGSDFVNTPSALIVFMGTLTITLMKFPLKKFITGFATAGKAFFYQELSNPELIREMISISKIYRKDGALALQKLSISNPFLERGVQLIVDGFDAQQIRVLLERDIVNTIDEQNIGRNLFRSIGAVAPAMGMVGTLIGLVQMLTNLKNPDSLGPAMAVALLTTLYGALIAHAFALPVADKLGYRIKEESAQRSLIIDGLTAIHRGANSLELEEILYSHLVQHPDPVPKKGR